VLTAEGQHACKLVAELSAEGASDDELTTAARQGDKATARGYQARQSRTDDWTGDLLDGVVRLDRSSEPDLDTCNQRVSRKTTHSHCKRTGILDVRVEIIEGTAVVIYVAGAWRANDQIERLFAERAGVAPLLDCRQAERRCGSIVPALVKAPSLAMLMRAPDAPVRLGSLRALPKVTFNQLTSAASAAFTSKLVTVMVTEPSASWMFTEASTAVPPPIVPENVHIESA
jgi:hypothetical protein